MSARSTPSEITRSVARSRRAFLALAFVAALPATALAHGAPTPSRSPSGTPPRSPDEDAPAEARQLWSELYCMCGECEHETLAECTCDSAARERSKIADRVRQLIARGPQGAAHDTVHREYVARYGDESQLGHFHPKTRFMWPELATTAGLFVVAGAVLVVVVEWVRRRLAVVSRGRAPAAGAGVFKASGKKRRRKQKP